MQLFQDAFDLLREREPQLGRVLQDGNSFIGDVEENDGRAQDRVLAENIDVQDVCDTDDAENDDLLGDALEADAAGQLLMGDRHKDAGNVVDHHKGDQGKKKAVCPAEQPAKNTADGRERSLYRVPCASHGFHLLFSVMLSKIGMLCPKKRGRKPVLLRCSSRRRNRAGSHTFRTT